MKESPVLIVVERFINLLIPYHAATGSLNIVKYHVRIEQERNYHTEISTNLIQKVFPTKSSASTAAPWSPV